ncbi:MAG TPA: hypothetical protein VGN72_20495 [Tepidisphaeraceae bacterium]|jgi:hypothetical protein|nr:hypothetical protein [Tepidisphaeraceae bacterium]
MAKKKSESAPKTTKKAASSKPAAGGSNSSMPQIDTNLAAAAAAKALAAGRGAAATGASTPSTGESSAFKQMKAGLNKPTFGGATGNLLNNVPNAKKSNTGFGGGKQLGRNQTFGADVNRTGVPRRTSGG